MRILVLMLSPLKGGSESPSAQSLLHNLTCIYITLIHVAQGDGMTPINLKIQRRNAQLFTSRHCMCSSQNAASATSGMLQANPGAPSIMIRMRAHVSLVPPHTSHASNLGLRQAAASQAEKRHRLTRHCFLEPRRTQRTWTNRRRTRRSCLRQPCHWERLKQSSPRHRAR